MTTPGRPTRPRQRPLTVLLALVVVVVWCDLYGVGMWKVRQALFDGQVGVVYSKTLVKGQATIETCDRESTGLYRCRGFVDFEPTTTTGAAYSSCRTRTVLSTTAVQGKVPVLGHYGRQGRSERCRYATTLDYPKLPASQERDRTIFSWVAVAGLVLWTVLGLALAGLVSRFRRRPA